MFAAATISRSERGENISRSARSENLFTQRSSRELLLSRRVCIEDFFKQRSP